jgi:hypothetical protein
MARARVLEVDKEGNLKLQVQATSLPNGVTLLEVPAPTVVAQKRVGTDPEDWVAATGVTIDQIEVTDRLDIRRLPTVVVLAASQAIQFRWKQDPDAQPDPDDDPVPGDNYRVSVKAQRSDGSYDWVRKFPVRINP